LSRLPDIFRVVLVLCDLEGKTRKEAARHLGLPEGTVGSRLARARALLAKRLTRRGVGLSGGALAAVLADNLASAGMPASVVKSTISAASVFGAGQMAAAGLVSVEVAALTEGVLKAMSMTKIKAAFVLTVLVCVLGWGGGVVVWQAQAEAQPARPVEGELTMDQPLPDLSGTWQGGSGWGTVVLRRTKDAAFAGTYTDTFGKDVGRMSLRWSSASRRYEGTWSEGKYRFGRIALEPAKVGAAISGAWTTDPKCEHQPGVPSLASLRWNRPKSGPGAAGGSDVDETPRKKPREDADSKPIKIRVYVEKVNVDTSTITASCMLIGEFDNVTKPLRLENLRVAEKARITDRGKEVKMTDLKLLPRDTHFYLFLNAYEAELGFEVVRIETIRQ
jgi:hypothetical protein